MTLRALASRPDALVVFSVDIIDANCEKFMSTLSSHEREGVGWIWRGGDASR